MKTKTIFKTLALAMLMPTMLLTTACSSEDDVVNTSNITSKGYALPVTVSATRQDGATRASYNESTRKLEFSAGDKLFVWGAAGDYDYEFAGELDYVSEGTFSGTIYTSKEWTGTADALFTAASAPDGYVNATLLPAGYGSYGFLTIEDYDTEDKYDDFISYNNTYTLATSKAAGVEQFSYEEATTYSNGFDLSPNNAILNFTITGLAASTNVAVSLTSYAYNITGTVTTDSDGKAVFAAGVEGGTDLYSLSLTVAGNPVTLVSSSKVLEAGHIYNISRNASPLASVTTSDVGKVIGADGNIYDNVEAAEATTTACAIIAYVGTAGSVDASSASYKGLAIALTDANSGSTCQWYDNSGTCLSQQTNNIATAITYMDGIASTNTLTSDGHTHAAATAAKNFSADRPTGASAWFLPSMGQWNLIVQGLATKKAGSAVTTNLTIDTTNNNYKADNLNSVITAAGGTGLKPVYYWSSSEFDTSRAWSMLFAYGRANSYSKSSTSSIYVRAVFAF